MEDTVGGPKVLQEGAFAGWMTWSSGADPYETSIGPFVFRDVDGRVSAAFLPRREHLNGGGAVHGGALMSFADFTLFAIAYRRLVNVHAVTLTCNCEFLGAGAPGQIIEADGEVLRETGSFLFVRGVARQVDRPLLAFSGTLKKLSPTPRA
ncbi:MAG: PaaI family thioesterase [Hyphomonadaceae bacterium]|nr:PaaI family thioesterase [Hyphomonadaceae bacterium]